MAGPDAAHGVDRGEEQFDDGEVAGVEGLGDVEHPEGFEEFAGVGLGTRARIGEQGVVAVVEAAGGVGEGDVEGEAHRAGGREGLSGAAGQEGVGLGGGGSPGEGVPGEGEERGLHRRHAFRR
ncbi:hypothetical protein ACH4E7_23845 [Kitasatospora sp. NPDC018058]|uniref:hypothetical protein n=1 Tax=Kitasatospora sp. NPDC018058 TaxID=3364025 RepID=UPI0037BE7201